MGPRRIRRSRRIPWGKRRRSWRKRRGSRRIRWKRWSHDGSWTGPTKTLLNLGHNGASVFIIFFYYYYYFFYLLKKKLYLHVYLKFWSCVTNGFTLCTMSFHGSSPLASFK